MEMKEKNRKRAAVAAITLDLRTKAIEQQAVIREAGERVADGQNKGLFLLTAAFRRFGAEDERHQGQEAKESLQEKKRIVCRFADEGPSPMYPSADAHSLKQANAGSG